ncbi:MAG: hypothetical protein PHQ23_01335 [Candidatus Wallbacteria bacterium]|nr:hypothetical protein [Candidatus Wallbacteria bacterium]
MERNEIFVRLQAEFGENTPNVRKICELMIQLGFHEELKHCFSLDDLNQLWQRIRS